MSLFARHFLLLLCLFTFTVEHAQSQVRADFSVNKTWKGGFDRSEIPAWEGQYEWFRLDDTTRYHVPYISVLENSTDTIDLVFKGGGILNRIRYFLNDSIYEPQLIKKQGDTLGVVLPAAQESYSLRVFLREKCIGKINVEVYSHVQKEVILVPMTNVAYNLDSIQASLNSVYGQAQVSLKVKMAPLFFPEDLRDSILSNPSPAHDRYTAQMILIRDAYFELHPNLKRDAYYVFITSGFTNEEIRGYAVRNKAVLFIKPEKGRIPHRELAKQLGFALGSLNDSWLDNGPEIGSTDNLMDEPSGLHLSHRQWTAIQRSANSVSYFDDYEDVNTNSGVIGYYFWEEDANGNIRFDGRNILKGIKRPFKRNQYSLHLDIDNWFFKPLFTVRQYKVSLLHLLSFVLLFWLSIRARKRVKHRLMAIRERIWAVRFGLRMFFFGAFIVAFSGAFQLINWGYGMFEVKGGKLDYLYGLDLSAAIETIVQNKNTARLTEQRVGSSLLIKRGEEWFLERRKKVLYFEFRQEDGDWTQCNFTGDSDSLNLITKSYAEPAASHYFVCSYVDHQGEFLYEKVYNHIGSEITDKIALDDPAERVLLFVNGYRPTSLGQTFEENFSDVQKYGLEHPDSKNLIYNFDRYGYWSPWKEIDLLFKNRINATQTLYADGHFSVATSNHRSLLNFTSLAAAYPQRCIDPDHHVCRQTSMTSWFFFGGSREMATVNLHNLTSNRKGFNYRRRNGRIAGKNLLQMFNELPGKSSNDTLYIVAHSMGYAYSLGILDELRGKINFGGFYIIAPENAEAGRLNPKEWEEVWQYGSDFERHEYTAPCLLDGIAPQTRAAGLPNNHRAFIPEKFYTKMGFYDSHFIGHYTWIFGLEQEAPGFIRQR